MFLRLSEGGWQSAGRHRSAETSFSFCPPGWSRTNDLLLKREQLYQLSYGRSGKILSDFLTLLQLRDQGDALFRSIDRPAGDQDDGWLGVAFQFGKALVPSRFEGIKDD